jgi:hypothetical protein
MRTILHNFVHKNTLLFILCGILSLLVAISLFKQPKSYLFRIEGIHLNNDNPEITVGRNDGVIFKNSSIDTGLFTIKINGSYLDWNLKKPFYTKINGLNINKIPLNNNSVIRCYGQTIRFQQVKDLTAKYPNQKYYDLHDIAGNIQGDNIESDTSLHSLIYHEDNDYYVILLEDQVSCVDNRQEFKTITNGKVPGNELKLEFIEVKIRKFISRSKPLLNNKDINVPTIRTEWESSHLLFHRHEDKSLSVYFSQPLTISIPGKDLAEISKESSTRSINIAQENTLFDNRCFYFENFSALYPLSLATIILPGKKEQKKTDIHFVTQPDTKNSDPVLQTLPLSRKKTFNVKAPFASAHLIANQAVITGGTLAWPFVFLLIIVILSAWAVYFFTHPSRNNSIVEKWVNNEKIDIDAEQLSYGEPGKFSSFFKSRLPVFLFIYFLLTIKLILVTKLCFTHPFFPQLYFIGTSLAFTTPLFMAYLWIKNSWSYKGKSPKKGVISANILLGWLFLLLVASAIYGAFAATGRVFYSSYFASYSYMPSLNGFLNALFHIRHIENVNTLYEEKLLQIPILILFTAIVLVLFSWLSKLISMHLEKRKKYPLLLLLMETMPVLLLSLFLFFGMNLYVITHIILISVCYFLISSLESKLNKRHLTIGVLLLILVGISLLWKKDPGAFINYMLVFLFLLLFAGFQFYNRMFQNKKGTIRLFTIPFFIILLFAGGLYFIAKSIKPDSTSTDRNNRRMIALTNPTKGLSTGGRQYISDMQFFEIMKANALESFKNPSLLLSDRDKPLHNAISKGKNPVIINDLSPLLVLEWGGWGILVLLTLLFIALFVKRFFIFISGYEIEMKQGFKNILTFVQLLRWVPILIIVSNSAWMIISIFRMTFFTGRVVNGLGVDSFADWLEFISLCFFMGFSLLYKQNDLEHGK